MRTVNGVVEVREASQGLGALVTQVRRDPDIVGIDLGPGYKRQVVPLLDGLDPEAQVVGTADTVSRRGGAVIGWNTERNAFAAALGDAGIDGRNRSVLVIGSGAGAAAAANALKGAAKSIRVTDRNPQAADRLWRSLQIPAGGVVELGQLNSVIPEVDLLVNAAGSTPPFSLELLGAGQIVFDLVYEPPVTPLVRGARTHGARAANGLGMLLHRGLASFEIWTGEAAPEQQMRSALERAALEHMSR